jgi:hypothetical protein
MHGSISAGNHSPGCPFCEVYQHEHIEHDSARCPACSGFLSDGLLKALRRMTTLPDILGRQPASAATRR